MAERIAVFQLARELGIKHNDVMELGYEVGVALTRVAALMTPAQADRIRARVHEKAEEEDRKLEDILVRSTRPRPESSLTTTWAPPKPRTLSQRELPPDVCDCCQLRIEAGQVRCGICAEHYFIKGEADERRDARVADHEARHVRAYTVAWAKADEYHGRMRSALSTRDNWRAALVEVMALHSPGQHGCKCGAGRYPCSTIKKLEQVSRGISRQVERYLAMPERQMREALYDDGRDYVA